MKNPIGKRILSVFLALTLVPPVILTDVFAAEAKQPQDTNALLAFSQEVSAMIQNTAVSDNTLSLLESDGELEAFSTGRLIVKAAAEVDPKNALSVVSGFQNLHVLQFASPADAYAAYLEYQEQSNIVYVEPDYIYEMPSEKGSDTPDDLSLLSDEYNSWGYLSDCMNMDSYQQWLLAKVGAEENLPEITVAVVDSGVNLRHTDLKDRLLSNGYDFVNEDNDPMDDHGHGSHVSGIVVDGTLSNVKILPVKVLNENNSCTSLDFALGIYYAVDQGADIINASIGFTGYNYTAQGAFDYAEQNGVTTVVSAGNSSADAENYSPACFDNTISVAAAERDYNWYEDTSSMDLASYSNYGDTVDVTAPGSNIWSTYYPCWGDIDTYEVMSGTSMASPHVAAAAAMLLSSDTSYTPQEIKLLLEKACILELECNQSGKIVPNMLSMEGLLPSNTSSSAFAISRESAIICPGQSFQLAATAGTSSVMNWRSDNPSVATVSNDGTVTGVACGTTKIHAFYKYYSLSCTVTVEPLSLALTPITLYPGGGANLICGTNCDPAPMLTWSISDKSVIDFTDFDGGYEGLTYPAGSTTVGIVAASHLTEEATASVTVSFGEVSATSLVTVTFPEMAWYDPNVFAYYIKTEEDLWEMAHVLNYGDVNGLEGKTVYLDNDISLSKEWTQMPSFDGTFDGQGHTISNLTIRAEENYTGLFGYLSENGLVKNLSLRAADIQISGDIDYLYAGGIVGYSAGQIENCHFAGTLEGENCVGGIVGATSRNAAVWDCTSEGSVTGVHSIGGIVGNNGGTVENCINDAEVSASLYAGGIAGWSSRYIRKCTNNGSLENNSACAGGIVGYNSFEVSDCVNYGSIGKPNLAHTVGGICGEAKEMIISNCENYGTVYGILQIGGIAGNITEPEWADGYMDSCSNYGMIIAAESSSKIGGICGNGNGNIINCINSGDISVGKSSMYIGGIGGDLGNVYTLVNCINTGKITGTGAMYVGGIAGKIYGSSFGNCVSTGALNITNGSYAANIVGEWVSDYYAITNCYALNNNFSADAVAEENCRVISQKSLSTDAPQLTSSVSVGDYTGNDLVQALNALVWREYTESEYYLYYPLCFWKYQDGIWMRAGAVSVKTTEDAVAELLTVFPLKSGTSLKDYNVLAATYLASGKMQDVIGLDFIDEYDTPTYLEEIDGSSLKFSTFKILILDEKYSPYQPVVTVSGS